jgi:hypothetical protein
VYRLGVVTVTDAVTITVIAISTTTATTVIIIIITFTITAILKRITLYDHHSINREEKEHTINLYYYILMNKAVTNVSSNRRRTASLLYPMMLGEVTEDERARWMRMLVVLGLAGLIIIFSPDIISFMTGLSIPANPVDNNNDGLEDTTGLPINTVRATLNLFLMLRFLGVAVAVIGGVFSAVKL